MNVTFSIPGAPVPKARARKGKRGNFYTPRTTAAFEGAGKILAKLAMHGAPLIDGAVEVSVALHLKPPKKNQRQWPTTKPDLDNVGKSILDVLNETILKDDSQVVRLSMSKAYTNGDPRSEIEVRPL